MIPVLYLPNTTGFSSFGLGVLTDTAACEVTEERNGVFECLLKYPVSGQHYGLITKECVIKAKSNGYRHRPSVLYLPYHKAPKRPGLLQQS